MEKIRCFVAVDLPREIVDEIERVQGEIGKKKVFNGKFTEGENLHLTLKFLGEIEEKKILDVVDALNAVEMKPFKGYLGELGVFSPKFIRIVWVSVLGKVKELQEKVDGVLKDLFDKENRFMGHVTIARVKNVKDKKLFLEKLKEVSLRKLEFEIDRFFLLKSVLKPEGPEYEILNEFRL